MNPSTAPVSELLKSTGVLLIGHGTRDPQGVAEVFDLARLFSDRFPHACIEACFLEMTDPTIDNGIDRLTARGVDGIIAIPMLLFSAGHAKEDIPDALAAAQKDRPGLEIRLTKHFGCHQAILELSTQRYLESLKNSGERSAKQLLIMVGRGSRDLAAQAEMQKFCNLRRDFTPVDEMKIAYMAMADPLYEKALKEVEKTEFRQIVVQPHLLFQGALLGKLQKRIEQIAAQDRLRTWKTVSHLGPDPLVIDAITDQLYETVKSA